MKKIALTLSALLATSACAFAFPKALYVKQGDSYAKYNFGVARDLQFLNDGHALLIKGYGETIDLDKIDYISFSAPTGAAALTPAAQKEKLVKIGHEAFDMVDLHQNAELAIMWSVFNGYYGDGDCDGVIEYEVPQEYWDVHNIARETISSAMKLAQGDVAAARVLKAKAVDLYRAQDYFGIYKPDYDKEEWVKVSDADYLQFSFRAPKGDDYIVRLDTSKEFSTWETVDFKGELPSKMTVSLMKGNVLLGKAEIKSNLVQDKSIDLTLDFEANGYVVKNTMAVSNTRLDDRVRVDIDGKEFCDVTTTLWGKNLVNYDSMYADIRDALHHHDADDNCIDGDPTKLIAHFIRANSDADLIGQLQVKGKAYGFSTLYDEISVDEDLYRYFDCGDGYSVGTYMKLTDHNEDYSILDVTGTDTDALERKIRFLNNYSDLYFCYDGNPQPQGYLTWEMGETDDDYVVWDPAFTRTGYLLRDGFLIPVHSYLEEVGWDDEKREPIREWSSWYYHAYNENYESKIIVVNEKELIIPVTLRQTDYEATPLLTFPDLTTFRSEDFFDEGSFTKLIDDYWDILNTYLSITGQD